MPTYIHRVCDRAGRTLSDEQIDFATLQEVMAYANIRLRSLMHREQGQRFDPRGRIEIADCTGHPVARIYCAEAIAASS